MLAIPEPLSKHDSRSFATAIKLNFISFEEYADILF